MKNIRKITALLMSVILAAMFASCKSEEAFENESASRKVAVSITPQKEFVEAVCGDKAEVIVLIPSGNSPANYEPTPEQIAVFEKSDVYFSIGVPTEESNIIPSLSENTDHVKLALAVNSVYPDLEINGGRDPHIWLSPKRAVVMVNAIAEKMSEVDPENADFYSENAETYTAKLDELQTEMTAATEQLSSNKFIAFHPAFAYLADDFGLEMYSLEEHGKESSPEHLAEMIDFAKENGIKAVFYQGEIDSSQSASFAEEIGGKTIMLEPLAENYIDNFEVMIETISEELL